MTSCRILDLGLTAHLVRVLHLFAVFLSSLWLHSAGLMSAMTVSSQNTLWTQLFAQVPQFPTPAVQLVLYSDSRCSVSSSHEFIWAWILSNHECSRCEHMNTNRSWTHVLPWIPDNLPQSKYLISIPEPLLLWMSILQFEYAWKQTPVWVTQEKETCEVLLLQISETHCDVIPLSASGHSLQ